MEVQTFCFNLSDFTQAANLDWTVLHSANWCLPKAYCKSKLRRVSKGKEMRFFI